MFKIEQKGVTRLMYDYSKLLGKVIEVFGKQAAFAGAMGLSERSVSLKFNNKRDWKQQEIHRACELLEVDFSSIPDYFFTVKVQY